MVLLRAFFYVSSPEQELCFITGKGIWAMRIEMNNINKIIKGVSLLTDINLALESGHIYGFVGDNGSGKTVLFKVLLGLMHKTSGTILVDGREQKDLMQDVGFIIERPEYIPYYSAKKNLEIIAAYRKVADDQRICTVLEMFGLDPSDKKALGKYSLGMKQKLMNRSARWMQIRCRKPVSAFWRKRSVESWFLLHPIIQRISNHCVMRYIG